MTGRSRSHLTPGRPAGHLPNRIFERDRSTHDPETAISGLPEMDITPGQNGCAARDSNPEPAD